MTREVPAPAAEPVSAPPAPGQETMVVVKRANGETYFWDGIDLRKRIEFARIGLDLCLANEQIHGSRTPLLVAADWPGYFPNGPATVRLRAAEPG